MDKMIQKPMKEYMTFEDVMSLFHRSVSEVFYLIEKLGLPVEPRLCGEEFRFSIEKMSKWHRRLPINLRDSLIRGKKKRFLTWDEVLDEYDISENELLNAVKFKSIPYFYRDTFLFDRKNIEVFVRIKQQKPTDNEP